MQNFLRPISKLRRVSRWGDQCAVQRAVMINFSRLTGLPTNMLKIACPFWEARKQSVRNYIDGYGITYLTDHGGTSSIELTERGLQSISGGDTDHASIATEVIFGEYIIICLGVDYGADSGSHLVKASQYSDGDTNQLTIQCDNTVGSGTVTANISIPGQSSVSLSVPHEFTGAHYTTIGLRGNASGTCLAVNNLSHADRDSTNNAAITDNPGFFEVTSSSGDRQFLGGFLVIAGDSTWDMSARLTDEIMEILMLRGWELFQPASFTDYFIGPAVDDVLITYDPNVSKDEDLTLDLNLFAQLLMTLAFDASQDLEGEGGLFADTWLAYVHLSSVCEALADVTFAGVFIEVLKSGVLDTYVDLIASGYVKVEQLAGFEGRGELAGYGKILRQINATPLDAQGELEGYLTLNTLIKDGNLSAVGCLGWDQLFLTNVPEYFETTEPAWFYTNECVPPKVMISVKVAEVLNAEVSFDYEFVPGGSVFIDWIVGEVGTSLVNSLIWGYVGNAEALYTTVSMMAEVHAEYSVSIVQGFLSVHAALLAADQIVNLPTTGDLRKTDLITLKLNLDLITLRR